MSDGTVSIDLELRREDFDAKLQRLEADLKSIDNVVIKPKLIGLDAISDLKKQVSSDTLIYRVDADTRLALNTIKTFTLPPKAIKITADTSDFSSSTSGLNIPKVKVFLDTSEITKLDKRIEFKGLINTKVLESQLNNLEVLVNILPNIGGLLSTLATIPIPGISVGISPVLDELEKLLQKVESQDVGIQAAIRERKGESLFDLIKLLKQRLSNTKDSTTSVSIPVAIKESDNSSFAEFLASLRIRAEKAKAGIDLVLNLKKGELKKIVDTIKAATASLNISTDTSTKARSRGITSQSSLPDIQASGDNDIDLPKDDIVNQLKALSDKGDLDLLPKSALQNYGKQLREALDLTAKELNLGNTQTGKQIAENIKTILNTVATEVKETSSEVNATVITPNVNDAELVRLNSLLGIAEDKLNAVISYFNAHPITIQVNDTEFGKLAKPVNITVNTEAAKAELTAFQSKVYDPINLPVNITGISDQSAELDKLQSYFTSNPVTLKVSDDAAREKIRQFSIDLNSKVYTQELKLDKKSATTTLNNFIKYVEGLTPVIKLTAASQLAREGITAFRQSISNDSIIFPIGVNTDAALTDFNTLVSNLEKRTVTIAVNVADGDSKTFSYTDAIDPDLAVKLEAIKTASKGLPEGKTVAFNFTVNQTPNIISDLEAVKIAGKDLPNSRTVKFAFDLIGEDLGSKTKSIVAFKNALIGLPESQTVNFTANYMPSSETLIQDLVQLKALSSSFEGSKTLAFNVTFTQPSKDIEKQLTNIKQIVNELPESKSGKFEYTLSLTPDNISEQLKELKASVSSFPTSKSVTFTVNLNQSTEDIDSKLFAIRNAAQYMPESKSAVFDFSLDITPKDFVAKLSSIKKVAENLPETRFALFDFGLDVTPDDFVAKVAGIKESLTKLPASRDVKIGFTAPNIDNFIADIAKIESAVNSASQLQTTELPFNVVGNFEEKLSLISLKLNESLIDWLRFRSVITDRINVDIEQTSLELLASALTFIELQLKDVKRNLQSIPINSNINVIAPKISEVRTLISTIQASVDTKRISLYTDLESVSNKNINSVAVEARAKIREKKVSIPLFAELNLASLSDAIGDAKVLAASSDLKAYIRVELLNTSGLIIGDLIKIAERLNSLEKIEGNIRLDSTQLNTAINRLKGLSTALIALDKTVSKGINLAPVDVQEQALARIASTLDYVAETVKGNVIKPLSDNSELKQTLTDLQNVYDKIKGLKEFSRVAIKLQTGVNDTVKDNTSSKTPADFGDSFNTESKQYNSKLIAEAEARKKQLLDILKTELQQKKILEEESTERLLTITKNYNKELVNAYQSRLDDIEYLRQKNLINERDAIQEEINLRRKLANISQTEAKQDTKVQAQRERVTEASGTKSFGFQNKEDILKQTANRDISNISILDAKKTAVAIETIERKLNSDILALYRARLDTLKSVNNETVEDARKTKAEIVALESKIADANKAVARDLVSNKKTGIFGNIVEELKQTGVSLITFGAIFGAAAIPAKIATLAIELEKYRTLIREVVKDNEKSQAAFGLISSLADEYGGELGTLTNGYAKLLAASKSTNLTLQDTEALYKSLVIASTGLQLSSEELGGTIKAFVDGLSKGTLQAEELRGQLGDRLVGAFGLVAQAMGITTQELNDQLKAGLVETAEVARKLAPLLESEYGNAARAAANTTQGLLNRISASFGFLAEEFGKDFLPTVVDGLKAFNDGLKFLKENSSTTQAVITGLLIATTLFVGQATLGATAAALYSVAVDKLGLSSKKATADQIGLANSVGAFIGKAGIFIAIAAGVAVLAKAYDVATTKSETYRKTLENLIETEKRLAAERAKNDPNNNTRSEVGFAADIGRLGKKQTAGDRLLNFFSSNTFGSDVKDDQIRRLQEKINRGESINTTLVGSGATSELTAKLNEYNDALKQFEQIQEEANKRIDQNNKLLAINKSEQNLINKLRNKQSSGIALSKDEQDKLNAYNARVKEIKDSISAYTNELNNLNPASAAHIPIITELTGKLNAQKAALEGVTVNTTSQVKAIELATDAQKKYIGLLLQQGNNGIPKTFDDINYQKELDDRIKLAKIRSEIEQEENNLVTGKDEKKRQETEIKIAELRRSLTDEIYEQETKRLEERARREKEIIQTNGEASLLIIEQQLSGFDSYRKAFELLGKEIDRFGEKSKLLFNLADVQLENRTFDAQGELDSLNNIRENYKLYYETDKKIKEIQAKLKEIRSKPDGDKTQIIDLEKELKTLELVRREASKQYFELEGNGFIHDEKITPEQNFLLRQQEIEDEIAKNKKQALLNEIGQRKLLAEFDNKKQLSALTILEIETKIAKIKLLGDQQKAKTDLAVAQSELKNLSGTASPEERLAAENKVERSLQGLESINEVLGSFGRVERDVKDQRNSLAENSELRRKIDELETQTKIRKFDADEYARERKQSLELARNGIDPSRNIDQNLQIGLGNVPKAEAVASINTAIASATSGVAGLDATIRSELGKIGELINFATNAIRESKTVVNVDPPKQQIPKVDATKI